MFLFAIAPIKWRCDHEAVTCKLYYECMGYHHSEFFCQEYYMFMKNTNSQQLLLAEQQGECCGKGVLEIKCRYCITDGKPDLANVFNDGSLQKAYQYYYQIQAQMFCLQC